MTAKRWWKKTWRAIRVARREVKKANLDAMIYGTGVVRLPNDDSDPRHIPIADTYILEQR